MFNICMSIYKLELYFQSDVKGVYTKIEETATTLCQMERKKTRMLRTWYKIFFPDNSEKTLNSLSIDDIQKHIYLLNEHDKGDQEREFHLRVSENENVLFDYC